MSTAAPMPAKRSKTPNQIVSSNIRAILKTNELDQAWLAERLGQNPMWLSRRLSNSNTATFSTDEVQETADILGVPVGDLFADRRTIIGGGSTFLGVSPLHPSAKRAVGSARLELAAPSV